jgi:thiol-disulfide isomerase/thioredoxin
MIHRLAGLSLLCGVVLVASGRGAAPGKSSGPSRPSQVAPAKLPEDWKEALAAAKWLEKAYAGKRPPESVRMLVAIAKGSRMGPGDGWFGPAQTRYTWGWLARFHGLKEGALALGAFRGERALFRRLDRDRDGRITAEDLDWSDSSPYLRQLALVNRLFYRINSKRDGRITRDELLSFFKAAAQGKEYVTPEDLHGALFGRPRPTFTPADAPSPAVLVRGLFAGEIGSLNEGPSVEQPAPDFTLKRPDGKGTVRLSKLLGSKPIVLVFGNFTCGPFRSMYPEVEEVYERYRERAHFVGVYVREAHPTDGWAMASNKHSGVAVQQPKTYQERVAVCTQFCKKLAPAIPFHVDEINDPVGHAYSGMPARLYVIDPKGKVAYKSGRGPFGFKVAEMEQALVMSLLEFPPPRKPEEKTAAAKEGKKP